MTLHLQATAATSKLLWLEPTSQPVDAGRTGLAARTREIIYKGRILCIPADSATGGARASARPRINNSSSRRLDDALRPARVGVDCSYPPGRHRR